MSSWHQFRVTAFDLAGHAPDAELKLLYREVYKWLKANASGKYKLRVINGRVTQSQTHAVKVLYKFSAMPQDQIVVCFKKQRDASLFKMFFGDSFNPRRTVVRQPARKLARHVALTKKIQSIISRGVGTMMANQIIGVQPMAGPTGQIFKMGTKYRGTMRGSTIKQRFAPRYPGMKSQSPSQTKAGRRRLRKKGIFEMPTTYMDEPKPKFPTVKNIKAMIRKNGLKFVKIVTSHRRGR